MAKAAKMASGVECQATLRACTAKGDSRPPILLKALFKPKPKLRTHVGYLQGVQNEP